MSPFPFDLVKLELERFPTASITWTQEEPKNMGGWFYVQPRLGTASQHSKPVRYVGYLRDLLLFCRLCCCCEVVVHLYCYYLLLFIYFSYVGRAASSAPATGCKNTHLKEQSALIEQTMTL